MKIISPQRWTVRWEITALVRGRAWSRWALGPPCFYSHEHFHAIVYCLLGCPLFVRKLCLGGLVPVTLPCVGCALSLVLTRICPSHSLGPCLLFSSEVPSLHRRNPGPLVHSLWWISSRLFHRLCWWGGMSHTRSWPHATQTEGYLYGFSMKGGGLWNWSTTVGLR